MAKKKIAECGSKFTMCGVKTNIVTSVEISDSYAKLLDDVYKVGHHGSRNGTDEDLMQAMSPEISVISASIHTQHGPGKFHGFQFGHPRENIVSLLEEFTTGKRDPVNVLHHAQSKESEASNH